MSTPKRLARALATVTAVAAAMVVTPILSSPAQADDVVDKRISRHEVLARAHHWLSVDVPYNQSGSYPDAQGRNYRSDCSGFVSMAWHLGTSRWTGNLHEISTAIGWSSLKPGDIVLRHDSSLQHVAIFERFTNDAKTRANFIAQANTADDMKYYRDVPISDYAGYTPRKYHLIFDDYYDPANEQAPRSTTYAKCAVSRPSDPTIDLPDRRDVWFEVRTCVQYENRDGDLDRYHAWITLTWAPGKDSDDNYNMDKRRFDGFMVHVQLQQANVTIREVYCHLGDNINASYTGSRTCHTSLLSTNDNDWTADGFVNWNKDGDGKYYLKPWYAHGSPSV